MWWGPEQTGILTPSRLRRALEDRPEWRMRGDRLVRELRFADYDEALAFVDQVARQAEDFGRHPDVCIVGGRTVRLSVVNHNRAGVTAAELRLVDKTDAAVQRALDDAADRTDDVTTR